jgi:signal transduction histidine kinase
VDQGVLGVHGHVVCPAALASAPTVHSARSRTLARSQRGLDRRDRLDLAAITRHALDSRQAEATARGLAVTASLVPAAPVAGGARLLERAASNLIDNAIRHDIPGGHIGVLVTAHGQPAIRITNTGPIIPADQAHRGCSADGPLVLPKPPDLPRQHG